MDVEKLLEQDAFEICYNIEILLKQKNNVKQKKRYMYQFR